MSIEWGQLHAWVNRVEEAWNQNKALLRSESVDTFLFEETLERLKEQLQNDGEPTEIGELAEHLYEEWARLFSEQTEAGGSNGMRRPVPIGGHRLPPLPYPYEALEPYIDREIMRLHHQKHHQSYVDGLNKAEKEMERARRTNHFQLIKHWEREAAFNGAGHYLHSIFWEVMSPHGGGEPKGELRRQIERDFGSFARFKNHFSQAAEKVEGVGWAILVWAPRAHRLEILQAEFHQNLSQQDAIPLLPLDVWEHAYYLQYKNERKDYIENWWNVVNWDAVEKRYNAAKQLRWIPY
ncbi:superoxide dismutase [Halalkalibacterium halodurans]|uniref:superoxide dismutase n=1 Tax=Halalkalibacterium halodurans TaxID=86665 RepID=A0A0M0KLH1_ALKHA|nr:superoxide dismutase [Halalkalibacterium halodurans]MED3646799.1 superoxide dismutase [Halalkalibacterium halodurans]TES56319.1 superoxide dismutase [Halalkalibacterium halodurans]TPE70491.1 superoxide dismutase [Halalkalibacterium halodurans]